jgi:hypothetical protein
MRGVYTLAALYAIIIPKNRRILLFLKMSNNVNLLDMIEYAQRRTGKRQEIWLRRAGYVLGE